MARDENSFRASSLPDDPEALRAETGETIVVSPQSERFRRHYSTAQPRTAKEFRAIVGLSEEASQTLRQRPAWTPTVDEIGGYLVPEELDSPDDHVRARASDLASKALLSYAKSANTDILSQVESAIARHLEILGVSVNLVALSDIYVADGATLVISSDTHVVEARQVVIEGSGKIMCSGFTKFMVESIRGN